MIPAPLFYGGIIHQRSLLRFVIEVKTHTEFLLGVLPTR